MSKNILLIGSQGFLGSHVKNLLDQNHENYQEIKNKKDVDIRNLEEFDKFVRQNEFKSIINCSAFVGGIAFGYKYQADLLQINSLMAVNIYEMAKKYKIEKVINPISNCVYPGHLELYEEKNFWNGPPHESVFNYGLSKRLMVGLGESFYQQYGITTSNVIMSNMYGPHDHFEEERSHALGAIIKKVSDAKKSQSKSIEIWGTGKPIREWLYVEDGAKALVNSLNLNDGSYLFNVGINKGSSINEISDMISHAFNWDGNFVYDSSKPDGVMKKTVNGDYGKRLLDWAPEVKLNDGIKKTVDWYIKNYE
ncbi:GDP-L-fucose synthase [bacterium]|nr:MAG: GDP-L-fucose synthase [bacterium]|tara:strand:+ start:439 stop:1362 length:924 start_codon:yes stop_codon:yes gene_type:complete